MTRILIRLTLTLLVASTAMAGPEHFPRPAELEPDVTFWKRIYSEVGTDGGLLHDNRDLSIVYEVVQLPSGLGRHGRERHTEGLKKRYRAILHTLASGKRTGLSREERRVLELFPAGVSNGSLQSAASRIRFQLGQADKFRAGVIRSGAYMPHILAVLREMNLPLEIAHLPHVESSFTPTAYSRVGAAGLWQFTRSTGRRFMQVDHVVDERLDPYRASIAAARLLEQNHRVTGSWPLAITAYNHGASGMRRAARSLGTKDIVEIVRKYRSRTFGFASRNFYVEFLAADAVASNAEFYFGPLDLDDPIPFETIEMPFYAGVGDIADALGIDLDTLEKSNPALRPTVWRQAKYVPKGFEIRVPRISLARPLAQGIAAIPSERRYARQTQDTHYTVRSGDTLSTIARRHGVRMNDLVALNGLRSLHRIRVGQKLRLPTDAAPTTSTVAYSRPASRPAPALAEPPPDGQYTVRRGDTLWDIARRYGLDVAELVALNDLRSQNHIAPGQRLRLAAAPEAPARATHPDATASIEPARAADPQPGPADITDASDELVSLAAESEPTPGAMADESAVDPSPGLLADPSDYTVASDGTIAVQANETLGHYAEWLGLRASRLRQINGLRFGQPVAVHQRLRLDFSRILPEDFERVRVDYHRAIQEEFFAEWEIEGTRTHRVGPGDSLWVLAKRRLNVPIWLLRQYNPDVDLNALSPGTSLTVPLLRNREQASSGIEDPLARESAAG